MKKIRSAADGYRMIWCPGCDSAHAFVVGKEGSWTLSGTEDAPTIRPSLLATRTGDPNYRCHSFVTDGKIQFLDDCNHHLKGQTVDMVAF